MDTSLSSYEGLGQQSSPVDVPALENTIAQLEHSARALQEERDQQQAQLQQLEETNLQLAAAVTQLTERNSSLTAELQRIAYLRAECDRLQQELEAESLQRVRLAEQTAHADRLLTAQQHEIDQLTR
ncbi:DNA recombination protein RmuC homolog [Pollicipes pollicipes]|uniref:DNA recombination protein RmuC homolog n=1 Tax=Pollicipes pollicipes TaxID=41117 RepID=UPI00188525AC|nr:DNA recombination protein RmuC homolog [Pollicipes pollicipes]